MDQVARTGETILVTKNGRPVAELRPHRGLRAKPLIGSRKGRIKTTALINRLWARGEVAACAMSFWKVTLLQARLDRPSRSQHEDY